MNLTILELATSSRLKPNWSSFASNRHYTQFEAISKRTFEHETFNNQTLSIQYSNICIVNSRNQQTKYAVQRGMNCQRCTPRGIARPTAKIVAHSLCSLYVERLRTGGSGNKQNQVDSQSRRTNYNARPNKRLRKDNASQNCQQHFTSMAFYIQST